MSDSTRKDFSTQAKETVKPDFRKSTMEKVTEDVTDTGDKIAAGLQPSGEKSATQQAADKTRKADDTLLDTTKTYAGQASKAVSGGVESAQDAIKSYTAEDKSGATTDTSHGQVKGGIVQQAQDTTGNLLDSAAKIMQDLADNISSTTSDDKSTTTTVTSPKK